MSVSRSAVLACLLVASGCYQGQRMDDQPKYEALEAADAFPDDQSARPRVPGTVAQNEPLLTGIPDENPLPITLSLLQRGRERFDIYCSPCHGRLGDGEGMIVQRGFPHPPSYHSQRLREAPDGHFFSVITHGYGAMYSYAARVPPEDRWAIVAYIRALQLSQHAAIAELPEDLAEALNEERP